MPGEEEVIKGLLAKASQARKHAKWLTDRAAIRDLNAYADELEARAAAVKRPEPEAATLPEEAANAPTGEPEIGPELIAAMKPPDEPPANED